MFISRTLFHIVPYAVHACLPEMRFTEQENLLKNKFLACVCVGFAFDLTPHICWVKITNIYYAP